MAYWSHAWSGARNELKSLRIIIDNFTFYRFISNGRNIFTNRVEVHELRDRDQIVILK